MIKTGTIIIAVSSVSVAQASQVCTIQDRTAFGNPTEPAKDVFDSCSNVDNDFAANCFADENGDHDLIEMWGLSTGCGNCLFGTMTTTFSIKGSSYTVNACLSAAEHTIDNEDCLPLVDTIILNECAAAWTTTGDDTDEDAEDDTDEDDEDETDEDAEDDTDEDAEDDTDEDAEDDSDEDDEDETDEDDEDDTDEDDEDDTDEDDEDETDEDDESEDTTAPSAKSSLSLASSVAVTGAMIVATWSA